MKRYKPYPAYKDSGVEWLERVPKHWKILPCRAFVDERTSRNEGGLVQDYLSLMANVGVIPYEDKGSVGNKKPDDLSKCKLVSRGDLIINSMNYRIGSYGLSEYNGVCSPVYIVLKPRENIVLERFALRVFENKEFQRHAQSFGTGILEHRSAIGWHDLKGICVGIPPFEEQAVILSILDRETTRIDALIKKKTRFIELLREKRQALITHAVTKGLDPNAKMKDSGVEWLGDVPEHWVVCKLSFRYSIELGKMLDEKKLTRTNLLPYLRNQDVQWDAINTQDLPEMDIHPQEIARYTVQHGDLMVCEGGDVGRAAIWRGEGARVGYQKALHRLRSRSSASDTAEFLLFALFAAKKRGVFEESDSKATIAHLPAEKFRQYRFSFPPKPEQREITEHLRNLSERIDTLQVKTEKSIELLKERRAALITAAVTGQIDLREAV